VAIAEYVPARLKVNRRKFSRPDPQLGSKYRGNWLPDQLLYSCQYKEL